SASGVAAGGRTGLTALSTAGMFLLSLFFAPLFILIPSAAMAPALVFVGLFMLSSVGDIDFNDYTVSIPAVLTIIMMPFSGSIAECIVFVMISYVVLKGITGRYKEVSWTMAVISVLFVLRIAFM